MLKWTLKSLLSQRALLIGSASGIASAFILVVFFSAVWQGESEQIVAYPNKMAPDVWVMQKGVANMHMAMSFVWDWKADVIQKMPEVERVTPILYLNSVILVGDKKLFAFVVGLVNNRSRAGPWKIDRGRHLENDSEIIVPSALSSLAKVNIGDKVQLSDKVFTIVGFSEGTYSSANPVFFTQFSDLEKLLSSFGTYSYLLVDSKNGVDSKQLAKKIVQQVDKVTALTHQEFVENDYALAKQMGVEIIMVMTFICSVLAALIVGYSASSLVNRQQREIAIIKAIGGSNFSVFLSVIIQSIIVTSIAFIVTLIFALFVLPLIPELVPQITVKVTADLLFGLGAIAISVATIGAFVPAFIVLKLDPAIAYQS